MLLALSNITRDRARFALSVVGVGLAVMLILLLQGYRAGIYRQTAAYLDHTGGDVVVVERGTVDFLGTDAILPPGAAAAARKTAGVANVFSIVAETSVVEMHGRKELVYLVGYDPNLGGGPWSLVEGREPSAANEVVIDRVLAGEHGMRVGDSLDILGRNLKVVGLSDGTALWMGSFVFAQTETVDSLIQSPGARSFLFVTPQRGVSAEDLRDRFRIAGTDALLKSDLIRADQQLFGRVYDAVIGLMTAIAFGVGVLVVALIVYTATLERRREYGAFKAIGASNRVLYRVVAAQALLTGLGGAALGTVLAVGLGELLVAWRPQFPVSLDATSILTAVAASLVMALLAALVPARSIARLAPAEVFR